MVPLAFRKMVQSLCQLSCNYESQNLHPKHCDLGPHGALSLGVREPADLSRDHSVTDNWAVTIQSNFHGSGH